MINRNVRNYRIIKAKENAQKRKISFNSHNPKLSVSIQINLDEIESMTVNEDSEEEPLDPCLKD